MDAPEVHYARSTGDVAIAYQVVGEGAEDIVLLPFLANIWSLWTLLGFGPFGHRLAERRRLIVINPRGVGLSDRPRGFTVESRMDDVWAVMDAVGSQRAAVLGLSESTATAAVFAASHPERVSSLLLFCPWQRTVADADRDAAFERVRAQRENYGTREFLEALAVSLNPQWADDAEYLESFVWHHRLTASPATFADFGRLQIELDITDVLPAIRVPTLVMAKARMRDDAIEVAEGIPGAHYVELPGEGLAIWENDFALEAIEEFFEGRAPLQRIPDTVLATLLFLDLVGSTERAAQIGDQAWGTLLSDHRSAVRRELDRYDGEELDTAGDGFFARFSGPARAIACARATIEANRTLGLDLRAGIHTGECELVDGKPAGLSVHVGARVSAAAKPGEVLVSSTVKDLVAGSDLEFAERGEHELKGVPGTWRLYAVAAEGS